MKKVFIGLFGRRRRRRSPASLPAGLRVSNPLQHTVITVRTCRGVTTPGYRGRADV
ncbi:hypothetical protein DFR76_102293 [Nocardia pseudobrasiliensis]|uniref:Uncharacterized protein n=1 Tax=Nocardia pseudobrasiliensis TaxID=45979 RepID=A0A370IAZ7_9NOCA|nr:hypothetical protein DFR76_102293 [Nocardia pseudobrasiliensis]